MLNFNQLRVFCLAAKHENFTTAAEKLFVTQPAVTAQIRQLESTCNLRLFKKRGRRIYLSDEGKILYPYVRRMFEYEKELEDVIEDMRELKRGVLRLGTTKAYARYFMPWIITRFRETYPDIKIHLDEGSSQDMTLSLVNFQNEIALIAKAKDHPDVHFSPFSMEELILIAAPTHPLAGKNAVAFDQIAREPIIMKEAGSGTRRLVNQLFASHGYTPDILMETSNTEFIKQLVQRGDGISFLVKQSVAMELEEGKLAVIVFEGSRIFLDVSVAYLKNQHLSPPAQAFLDVLGKLTPEEMLPQGIGALMAKMLTKRR
ncbi:MAG: LysR family transcriptional regulator [Deltaproteobacteria bacterium]|nr:LysR family transcriptional regulator [Deltaproteobacteria bacterium]